VHTDPYEYGQSLYSVHFISHNNDKNGIGVPCDEIPEISNATREEAGLNRGVHGTYGKTGITTTYWFSICPPYGYLEYYGYGGSFMQVLPNETETSPLIE